MKKVTELAMWTLLFSSLSGIGLTAGFYCFIATARLIDKGAAANIIITSTVFEFRRHVRVVDTVLMCTPGVIAERRGFFLMKTVISGRSKEMLRANKTAKREAAR